jgi:multidrug efflux pump subunit AcrA (membrane-fusion protein)
MTRFRPQAVSRHLSSDQRGGLLRVAPPWLLGVHASLCLLLLLALGVAAVGKVRIHAAGTGVVRPTLRTVALRAPRSGVVQQVGVAEGEPVGAGGEVVRLDERDLALAAFPGGGDGRAVLLERQRSRVTAPIAGTVEDLAVGPGEWVAEGDVLAAVVPAGSRLVGHLAVRERDAHWIRPGAPVRLKLDAYPYQEMGTGWGRVTRVAGDLLSVRRRDELGLPRELDGAHVLVEVEVVRLPAGAPGARLANGMGFRGEVILREQRIGVLLLRPLADLWER